MVPVSHPRQSLSLGGCESAPCAGGDFPRGANLRVIGRSGDMRRIRSQGSVPGWQSEVRGTPCLSLDRTIASVPVSGQWHESRELSSGVFRTPSCNEATVAGRSSLRSQNRCRNWRGMSNPKDVTTGQLAGPRGTGTSIDINYGVRSQVTDFTLSVLEHHWER